MPKQELADLDLTSRHGWYAAEHILSMSCKSMDFVLAKNFFTKTGQAIVKAWSANPEDPGTLIDSKAHSFSGKQVGRHRFDHDTQYRRYIAASHS